MRKEGVITMNKSILFILLELFTIRYYRDYRLSTIKTTRNFILTHIKKYDDFLQFKLKLYSDATMLSTDEFFCVRIFIEYLNSFDKIVKM